MKKILSLFVFFILMAGFATAASFTVSKSSTCATETTTFETGDTVYISASGFEKNKFYDWNIKGAVGSCDVDVVVASGNKKVDNSGNLACFPAYLVDSNDCGDYTATFDTLSKTITVPVNGVPEYGAIAAIILAVGIVGILVFRRK